MNIPYLRQTNADFIKWILEQKNGLYFEGECAQHVVNLVVAGNTSQSVQLLPLQATARWIKALSTSFMRRR